MRAVYLMLAALAMLAVAGGAYLAILLHGVGTSVDALTQEMRAPDTEAQITLIQDPEPIVKTGTLSKIINGTTVTLDYTWDCTEQGWRDILAAWKIICDNPPGGKAATPADTEEEGK